MLDSYLNRGGGGITLPEVLVCTGVALALGLVVALVYMFRNAYTKNFVATVALLPAMVGAVILLVNGNLGTGVAVMGAFGLVRFRSAPGSAREITSIFFSMAIGLATGMGYIMYAVVFTAIISLVMLALAVTGFGEGPRSQKQLRVTIPEDLDYNGLFDDLFRRYTKAARLDRVRSTSLGSLFELQYTITLKAPTEEKPLLDGIRQRNGNLNISCGMPSTPREEL